MTPARSTLLTLFLILASAVPAAAALIVESSVALGDTDARFNAASTAIDGVFAYELCIPFDEIGGKVAAAAPAKQRKLAVGVQIGGLTEAEQELAKSQMSSHQSDRGGGMGRPPGGNMAGVGGRGGGMGGGTRPGGPDGGRPTLDAEIDWLVVELPPTNE